MADKKPVRLINGKFPTPPFWMRALALIFLSLSLLVFFAILRSRGAMSREPRVHFIQDMDNQIKLKTQHASDIFADGEASRPKVLGTVARGHLDLDDHLHRGFKLTLGADGQFQKEFLTGFPVKLDDGLLSRGQAKFNTYCMPCHGHDGKGNGPVNFRADELARANTPGMAWVSPTNLTDATVVGRPDGHIFNTITNGIRNMGAYGPMIPDPQDRWAIVAYVRALQLSANGQPAQAAAK